MILNAFILACTCLILWRACVALRKLERMLDHAYWTLEQWQNLGIIPKGLTRKRVLNDSHLRAERRTTISVKGVL